MLKIYGKPTIDWMGYEVTTNNRITYHHIVEKHNGGERTIENGALLTVIAHQNLHKIEKSHPELYDEYQYWFKIINDMKCPPNEEVMGIMYHLKKRLETALQVNKIIKEEFDYYDECMKEQIQMVLCQKGIIFKKKLA